MKKLTNIEIANQYSLKLKGPKLEINNFSSLENQTVNTIIWCKSTSLLSKIHKGTLLIPASFEGLIKESSTLSILLCEKSPRLIFAKVLNDFFKDRFYDDFTNCVDEHKKNNSIKIGDNCFIGKNVKIGSGTEILHNTSIFSNTIIGKNTLINTGCSIGTPGLGFEYDNDEIVKFPQLGGVIIGDEVEIGPNSTIRRGALDETIIGSKTKIGALCNIGHNCIIGEQCILTCQIVLGGSTKIGNKVYMGINSLTKNKIKLGDDVTVGMGAVVTKNFNSGCTVKGVPAKITQC